MSGLARTELDALRARIAAIENRQPLARGAGDMDTGDISSAGSQAAIDGGIFQVPAGLVHEVFADDARGGGAALGFSLGLVRQHVGPTRRGVLYLQLAGEAQETGLPYALGLQPFGLGPDQLVLGRIATVPELLWAMEEAIACRAVAAVIADFAITPKALDFTVSRRLALRSAASGTGVLLLRYGLEREASAARLRWRVRPAASAGRAFDPQAPGPPRFRIGIEKRRLGTKGQRAEGQDLLVEWTENGFAVVEPNRHRIAPATRPRYGAALPGAVAATLGNRLSQAG